MDEQVHGSDVERAIRTLSLVDPLLRAVGTKVLALLTLAMTFGLFAWAMWRQTNLSFAIAIAFCIGALWPVLFIGWKQQGKPT